MIRLQERCIWIGRVAKRLRKGKSTLLCWEREHRVKFRKTYCGHRYLFERDLTALLKATMIPEGSRRKTRKPPEPWWWLLRPTPRRGD